MQTQNNYSQKSEHELLNEKIRLDEEYKNLQEKREARTNEQSKEAKPSIITLDSPLDSDKRAPWVSIKGR